MPSTMEIGDIILTQKKKIMEKRFSHPTNMLLNEHIRDYGNSPLFIDGEARTRRFSELKRNNQLDQLLYRNGELNYGNKWVVKVFEDFIIGHEGDYGENSYVNHLTVLRDLMKRDELYLLFEEHYGPDGYL